MNVNLLIIRYARYNILLLVMSHSVSLMSMEVPKSVPLEQTVTTAVVPSLVPSSGTMPPAPEFISSTTLSGWNWKHAVLIGGGLTVCAVVATVLFYKFVGNSEISKELTATEVRVQTAQDGIDELQVQGKNTGDAVYNVKSEQERTIVEKNELEIAIVSGQGVQKEELAKAVAALSAIGYKNEDQQGILGTLGNKAATAAQNLKTLEENSQQGTATITAGIVVVDFTMNSTSENMQLVKQQIEKLNVKHDGLGDIVATAAGKIKKINSCIHEMKNNIEKLKAGSISLCKNQGEDISSLQKSVETLDKETSTKLLECEKSIEELACTITKASDDSQVSIAQDISDLHEKIIESKKLYTMISDRLQGQKKLEIQEQETLKKAFGHFSDQLGAFEINLFEKKEILSEQLKVIGIKYDDLVGCIADMQHEWVNNFMAGRNELVYYLVANAVQSQGSKTKIINDGLGSHRKKRGIKQKHNKAMLLHSNITS